MLGKQTRPRGRFQAEMPGTRLKLGECSVSPSLNLPALYTGGCGPLSQSCCKGLNWVRHVKALHQACPRHELSSVKLQDPRRGVPSSFLSSPSNTGAGELQVQPTGEDGVLQQGERLIQKYRT